ncbi:MAG: dihydrolipoyl dehydrogenase [Candidatus Peregrinibacteria bacterium]|nr:dihydrolipoyl dehydrogenase [Candidatus Peregrinibacteria bacterium]
MLNYEAIIIGGGGGLKLRPISNMGHKIAIIEKEALGGTCLNRGCIPSKMLIHPADVLDEVREAHKFNLNVSQDFAADFSALTKRVTKSVTSSSDGIIEAYAKNENVDFYPHEARFVENKVLEVNGQRLTANRIFIAVGARPMIPKIEGLEGTPFMTSREALRLEKQPNSLMVIGGGYIGVELGHFYRSMGTEVDFLVRSRVLKNEDREVADEFLKAFQSNHRVHMGMIPKKVSYDGKEFTITVEDSEGNVSEMKSEALLVAAGIVPNSDTLSLENTEIELNGKGFVEVDDHLKTTVDGVYALGDVAGNYFFRHSVNFEGEYLLRTLYESPSDEPINYPPMPHAVFSSPQIGGVGKTEEELKAEGVDYVKGVNPYKDSAFGGDVLMSEFGLVKLLFERSSRKLLGAHIVGKEASSMIHMCIAYINMGATLDDMLNTIYIHPAFPEVIRNAARVANEALS